MLKVIDFVGIQSLIGLRNGNVKRTLQTVLVGVLALACVGVSVAQETAPAKPAAAVKDEAAAIRAASQNFVEAFNKADAKAVAAHWTANGELVDESGTKYEGRDTIEKTYAEFFQSQPKAKMQLIIDSIKLLTDSAAIEEGRSLLDPVPAGAPAMSKYFAVHVKVDGKWLMSTVRESRVETPSTFHHLSDLEWLVGTWTAEEHGAKTTSVCRWIGNKSFLERRYTVTSHEGVTTNGVQIIGWNPLAGHIQSWNFGSDGGHAIGVWSPVEEGWRAETQGVTGEGAMSTSTIVLRRLDDNAYVWQALDRTLDGESLPDSDEIVLKRSSK